METDWVKLAPFVTIFGPIVGALIGAAVTYIFVLKRKKITFAITRTEDLTSALRQHHQFMSFNIANRAVLNLNKATVHVKNSGNTTLNNLKFEIMVPENHDFHAAEIVSTGNSGTKLRQSIKIKWIPEGHTHFARCEVSVPFFNPKERFDVILFFDGTSENVEVICRLEDVQCKIGAAVDLFGDGPPLTWQQAIIRGIIKGAFRSF